MATVDSLPSTDHPSSSFLRPLSSSQTLVNSTKTTFVDMSAINQDDVNNESPMSMAALDTNPKSNLSQICTPRTTGCTPSETPLSSDNNLMSFDNESKQQKSRKPVATKADCESVREYYKYAQLRDIENILNTKHPHLIKKRNEIYLNCKKNGINEHSSVEIRLDIIGQVVRYCFFKIEPPNEYTAV